MKDEESLPHPPDLTQSDAAGPLASGFFPCGPPYPKPLMPNTTKKNNATKKAMTREEIVDRLAEATGLSRQQVAGLLAELASLVMKTFDQGPDEFTLPGLLTLKVVRKPATEPRIEFDPVSNQETKVPGKPVRHVLQVVPLRELKEVVGCRLGERG
jgi:nucleoid DNA-binding protein